MGKPVRLGTCPLLDKLPTEIRVQIYEYILFENGNFFSLDDDDEGMSVPTLFPKLRAPPTPPPQRIRRRRRRRQQDERRRDEQEVQPTNEIRPESNIMSLLLTNRLIYEEAASLLYSTSFFRLRGIHCTIQFINAVSPRHLARVRSLKLVWDDQGWTAAPEYDTPTLRSAWPSLCDALADGGFAGLQNLYVALGVPGGEAHVEEMYLRGLARVRHVDNFKVCIPVGFLTRFERLDVESREEKEAGGDDRAPFELCRHTAGEVCSIRREVITAEWLGDSRPSTPGLRLVLPNVPGMEPWADGEWETNEKEMT
ncbi:hypothetical protein M406DRAFT_330357 [Cryphonectria parasitica EP155]|uniref:DUF7730 domain-containing protein n=1 Tax=Cryphonectria parasitica (strain ATCC 38755 / EP155) TaxID=660469 RepID=A0A9P5CQX9_CRYP1|nr:uncharacterized protein M406DRAFT_330357 [Cryphonectria parasitica EP155]KAF3766550.1 hypothetical protein M406DRAFT_330357 [Cryphonectria parasitica EP155]